MKKSIAILLTPILFVGLVLLNTGCTSFIRNRISLTPQVGSLEFESAIPLEAALLITEESGNRLFMSSTYPDYKVNAPVCLLEPYQLPIGRAFESAALEVFAQVFKKIKTPIESGFWVTTPWLDDRVGELAAETLVLGLSDLAVQLAKDNPVK
jgi:hypothetical protein